MDDNTIFRVRKIIIIINVCWGGKTESYSYILYHIICMYVGTLTEFTICDVIEVDDDSMCMYTVDSMIMWQKIFNSI